MNKTKIKKIKTTICIDLQGGKGRANYQTEVSCTILSDSHGTPHAVCIISEDINQEEGISQWKTLKDWSMGVTP